MLRKGFIASSSYFIFGGEIQPGSFAFDKRRNVSVKTVISVYVSRGDEFGKMTFPSWIVSFSYPGPLVTLSRLGLVHKEQVALRTHDFIG